MSARPLSAPPPGFERLVPEDNFERMNGPFYRRPASDGSASYGFQSDGRHANSNGVLHGGALATFLDHMMGHFLASVAKRPTATIGLDCKFIAGVAPGAWIDGNVTVKRLARTLAFVDGEVRAEGRLLATATGIFRVFDR